MNSQQNSQDEQGFIATKLVAKVSDIQNIRDSKGKECKMFHAFFLPSGQGHLKQQMPQSIDFIQQFGIDQTEVKQSTRPFNRSISKGFSRNYSFSNSQHPYRFYNQNSSFQLIYSKNSSQQPIYNQFQYIKNDVKLQTAETKVQQPHSLSHSEKKSGVANALRNPFSRSLKPFDYSSPMPRNISIRSDSSSKNYDLLSFDSRFQSGNLYCAYFQTTSNQYHLFIQNDTNSYGYNQWFYFSLQNIKKDIQYSFVIVNFKKKHSFYQKGYKPIAFSLKKYQSNGNKNGWYRTGSNIEYQQSHISTTKFYKFYKLSFTLKFQHDDDYISVAANLPYSYSKLSNYIQKFHKQFRQSNQIQEIADLKISPVGRTFCGNNVPEIKLIPVHQKQRKMKQSIRKSKKSEQKSKKMLIFLARQHPGQTVSSYLMQNVLDQLSTYGIEQQNQTEENKLIKEKYKFLLKTYTIVIFPMINIDGVIYGNSRCDVSGMDLNRRWKNPSKIFHPQIFNIKSKIQEYSRKYDIQGCFDFHGHSKLYNVFCYSCKINPVTCRILPYLISKQTNFFYFPSCTFGITRQKSTTARATMFKAIKNQNVLTIQMSYFGFIQNSEISFKKNSSHKNAVSLKKQSTKVQYFQPKTFYKIASGILNGLSTFLNKQSLTVYHQIQNQIKQNLTQILNYEKLNHQNKEQQDSGSQSDPEGDQIDFETKMNTILGDAFLQQAQFFRPAQQQIIDVNALMNTHQIVFGQEDSPIHKKTFSRQLFQKDFNESKQRIENVNKIRIVTKKMDSANKTLSNQKFKSQLNFNETISSKPQKVIRKKQTISFSLNRSQKQQMIFDNKSVQKTKQQNKLKTSNISQRLYSQNNKRLMFGSKKLNEMLIKDELEQSEQQIMTNTQNQTPKIYDDLIIYSAGSKQMLNQKSNLLQRPSILGHSQNQFFIKFQKFLPSHPLPPFNKKQKLSFLEESIYKDDQREILNQLLQNKKKLQKQKLKRQIQKSTTIAQRFQLKQGFSKRERLQKLERQKQKTIGGIIGSNGKRKDQIVDFRKFKDRDKLKMQLKQTNDTYTRYVKKQGFF